MWTVLLTGKAEKQFHRLQESIQLKLRALVREIEVAGPVRGNWKNYGKLGGTKHHCHIKLGRPTYVGVVSSFLCKFDKPWLPSR